LLQHFIRLLTDRCLRNITGLQAICYDSTTRTLKIMLQTVGDHSKRGTWIIILKISQVIILQ
jgi:hypothetical protein